MLMDVLFNNKIWTILLTLILLFAIVNGLRYMGLYEGLENSGKSETTSKSAEPAEPVQKASKQQQIASVYNF
jgi:hypothetical protein